MIILSNIKITYTILTKLLLKKNTNKKNKNKIILLIKDKK